DVEQPHAPIRTAGRIARAPSDRRDLVCLRAPETVEPARYGLTRAEVRERPPLQAATIRERSAEHELRVGRRLDRAGEVLADRSRRLRRVGFVAVEPDDVVRAHEPALARLDDGGDVRRAIPGDRYQHDAPDRG